MREEIPPTLFRSKVETWPVKPPALYVLTCVDVVSKKLPPTDMKAPLVAASTVLFAPIETVDPLRPLTWILPKLAGTAVLAALTTRLAVPPVAVLLFCEAKAVVAPFSIVC